MLEYRIHGDNIVECERTWEFLKSAWKIKKENTKPLNSILTPGFTIDDNTIVRFFPGFGRWKSDILQYVKSQGGYLREAADSIITVLSGSKEMPIVAIEFSGALPAGNQAWQRSGRAFSFAMSGIPYLYICELGGFELNEDRTEKAMRLPNPVVPFSYITHTLYSKAPSLMFLIASPVCPDEIKQVYKGCFANDDFLIYLEQLMKKKNTNEIVKVILNKMLLFVKILSENRKDKEKTFNNDDWDRWLKLSKDKKSLSEFIVEKDLKSSKSAFIDGITENAKKILNLASNYSLGVGTLKLPFSIIPKKHRVEFTEKLQEILVDLSSDFLNWLKKDSEDLYVCWIAGFKPGGDDSRPDRGLPPLVRMLFGKKVELLSFVYGPAKSDTWDLFISNPRKIIAQNGLWESILMLSNAVLIESKTDTVTKKGYLENHWKECKLYELVDSLATMDIVSETPDKYGEHDIDAVIKYLFYSDSQMVVFEGLCNPPGGDWSGISILDTTNKTTTELRWLSLPRVSKNLSKRPDHLFQFSNKRKDSILIIESKETANRLEENVGKKLIDYVKRLFRTPSSAKRENSKWERHNQKVKITDYIYISAVGFKTSANDDFEKIYKFTKCDLIISAKFDKGKTFVNIKQCTPKAKPIIKFITDKNYADALIDIKIT